MSITAYTTPDAVKNVGCPVIYRVTTSSTDITTVIQAKLYFRRSEDDFFTLASTEVQQKAQGYEYYEFNFSSSLEKYLTSNYLTGSTGLQTQLENASIEWMVKFTEYYPSSAFTAQGTASFATGFYFINTGLFKTETQSTFTGSDWYMDAAGSHKFLTDSPSNQYLRASERIQLDILTSYTDPVVKVKETKLNGSNATVMYELPEANYAAYLWNWTVNASEVVTAVPLIQGGEGYVEALGAGGTYNYIADTGVMWGAIKQIKDEDVDIVLPYLPLATSPTVNLRMRSLTGTATYDIYYWYGGIWNSSGLATGSLTTTWTTFTQALPSGATKVRISVYDQNCYIAYGTLSYTSDNVLHKRCAFTLDTTHIDTDTQKLEIWVESTSSSSTIISEVKTFLVDTTPTAQATTRFAVKNKRGGFDHFTYTEMHSEILTAEKTRAVKELPNTFTTKDRETNTTQVASEKIFTCYSRYIEEAELQWWATIIESDEVYVVVSDVRYAVDIVTDSVITYSHTDLVQLKIDWTYAYKR